MPFVKGQSGNPKGGSKKSAAIKELAQSHCERAIARLAELMESEDEGIAVKACDILLERGYGKAPQAQELSVTGNIEIAWKGGLGPNSPT
jgi:hypothetical protein